MPPWYIPLGKNGERFRNHLAARRPDRAGGARSTGFQRVCSNPRKLVFRPLRLVTSSVFVSVCFLAGGAGAFERQWHLGGGAGAVLPSGPYALAPAAGAYASYGVSDVFDVKLQLTLARATAEPDLSSLRYGAYGALAYKLDVIQWIPYLGVRAGAVGVSDPVPPFEALSPSIGGIAGVDYAMTRSVGFGLELSLDYLLAGSGNELLGALLTAEYHFGY